MIKNLLEQDEYQPEKIKNEREETALNEAPIEKFAEPQYIEVNEAESLFDAAEARFDISDDSDILLSEKEIENINSFVEMADEPADFEESRQFNSPENSLAETPNESANSAPFESFNESEFSEAEKYETPVEAITETLNYEPSIEAASETINFEQPVETKIEEKPAYNNESLFQPLAEPESFAETARKSGLAYAAAITLFASIVFMLIIGWFADLLFGSSPWGVVIGVVIGSLIGFIQFFRMTSQIFKNKD
jgi:F0F1-type ATP synthase assembly protein I